MITKSFHLFLTYFDLNMQKYAKNKDLKKLSINNLSTGYVLFLGATHPACRDVAHNVSTKTVHHSSHVIHNS